MAGPYFSGGGGAAAAVSDILARRKAEARQVMLDELNAKVQQSAMEERAASTESLRMQREAAAANMKTQADDRFLKGIRDEGPTYELSPEEEAHLKAMGRGGLIMAPAQVSTTEDYQGTPEGVPVEGAAPVTTVAKQARPRLRPTYEQQQQELQEIMIRRALEDPNTSTELKQYLNMLPMFPKDRQPSPPSSLFESGETFEHDNDTGAIKDLTHPGATHTPKKGDTIVQRSRPPQPSAASQPISFYGIKTDPTTGAVTVQPATNPEGGPVPKLPVGARGVAIPQVPAPKPVSPGTLAALRKAQGEAKSQGLLGRLTGVNDAKQMALTAATSQYINEFPVQGSPEEVEQVRQFAREAFAYSLDHEASVDDILKMQPDIPPTIEAPLRGLLSVILVKQ